MAHEHVVVNTDLKFVIDADTRGIQQQSGKSKLIRNDHNSEKYEFEMPRYVDGHDMTLCDMVRVNYVNVSSDRKGESKGSYIISDLHATPEDSETVSFTWLVSRNCTMYAGTLNFNVSFMCTTDSTIDYAWHTDIFRGISVFDSIDSELEIENPEELEDVVASLKNDVMNSIPDWAKQPSKPTYTANEVNAISDNNGQSTGTLYFVQTKCANPSDNYYSSIRTSSGKLVLESHEILKWTQGMPVFKSRSVIIGANGVIFDAPINFENDSSVSATRNNLNVYSKEEVDNLTFKANNSMILTDSETGKNYELKVVNGSLTMAEVTE